MNKHGFASDALATADLHRAWLRNLPKLTGKSLSKIADETGIARSTLTKRLKPGDPGTSTLNATTIDRIVKRYRIPGPASASDVVSTRALHAGFAEDAAPYSYGASTSVDEAVRALSAGKDGIHPWTINSRAIELEGYLPGDIVLIDLNAQAQHGDAVCAEVRDFHGQVETIMRVFEAAGAVKLLVAKTMDPALQRSLVVDGDKVAVIGGDSAASAASRACGLR